VLLNQRGDAPSEAVLGEFRREQPHLPLAVIGDGDLGTLGRTITPETSQWIAARPPDSTCSSRSCSEGTRPGPHEPRPHRIAVHLTAASTVTDRHFCHTPTR